MASLHAHAPDASHATSHAPCAAPAARPATATRPNGYSGAQYVRESPEDDGEELAAAAEEGAVGEAPTSALSYVAKSAVPLSILLPIAGSASASWEAAGGRRHS
jgi:hypothetical protein